MPSGYKQPDEVFGSLDLDVSYLTEDDLINQFLGNSLWMWGNNSDGAIGDGTKIHRSSPVQVGSLVRWKQVSQGGSTESSLFSGAVRSDNTLWMWGYNTLGTLGDGTIIAKSSPIQVGTLTDWKTLVCGSQHCGALKTNGTIWMWGRNLNGAMGDSTSTTHRSSPVQIGALTTWAQLSLGESFTTALTNAGALWAWGLNTDGQLGQENITHRSSPVQIGSLTNWRQVSSGSNLSAAIKTDGTLWTWGNNAFGGLGDGTIIHRSSPVQVGSMNNWKKVVAGDGACLAIKTDGTLWAWGRGSSGQLGDGTTTSKSSPVQIGSLTNWKDISLSLNLAFGGAVKTDGTLWTWGQNTNGQLADGTVINRSSPVQVGTLNYWRNIASGKPRGAITYIE